MVDLFTLIFETSSMAATGDLDVSSVLIIVFLARLFRICIL